jgi:hypothetical protein
MNPPTSTTQADSLRGNGVLLEWPHELDDGVWDGPIYARLREARQIRPGLDSPFVIDDQARRPGVRTNLHEARASGHQGQPGRGRVAEHRDPVQPSHATLRGSFDRIVGLPAAASLPLPTISELLRNGRAWSRSTTPRRSAVECLPRRAGGCLPLQ